MKFKFKLHIKQALGIFLVHSSRRFRPAEHFWRRANTSGNFAGRESQLLKSQLLNFLPGTLKGKHKNLSRYCPVSKWTVTSQFVKNTCYNSPGPGSGRYAVKKTFFDIYNHLVLVLVRLFPEYFEFLLLRSVCVTVKTRWPP